MAYTFDDILAAYRTVGVTKGRTVLVKTDLRLLGPYAELRGSALLDAHLRALRELTDPALGTVAVSTASHKLINTQTVFDPAATPSERGVFTEFLRKQPGAVRSFHPFDSYAALGRHAEELCLHVARHGYGPETPKARMIEEDALCVTVGLPPRLATSIQHHVEHVMGVPYRYSKEYMHPVLRPEGVLTEPFYRLVWYRGCDLERDHNEKIFRHFEESGHVVRCAPLGQGNIYAFSMREMYRATTTLFRQDIYAWLKHPPSTRPYQI